MASIYVKKKDMYQLKYKQCILFTTFVFSFISLKQLIFGSKGDTSCPSNKFSITFYSAADCLFAHGFSGEENGMKSIVMFTYQVP